jgi:hypothetical protein
LATTGVDSKAAAANRRRRRSAARLHDASDQKTEDVAQTAHNPATMAA